MNKVFLFGFLIFSVFSISSCEKDKQVVYSCNSEINQFVKSNLKELSVITYDEIVGYEYDYQRAIFESLSPSNKCNLWIEKLNRTLELEWSNEEANHIMELKNTINPSWYDIESEDSINDEKYLYLHNWSVIGVSDKGFSIWMLVSVAGKLDIELDPSNPQLMMPSGPIGGSGSSGGGGLSDCDCSLSADFCPSTFNCETSNLCAQTAHGCGWVWTYACKGDCK